MTTCIKAPSLRLTARRPADTAYVPIQELELAAHFRFSGNSALGQNWELIIQNNSHQPFQGVVHAELCFLADDPAFFMPAFLYQRNRGNVQPYQNQCGQAIAFPRLTTDPSVPGGSDFWMVRSDRLSHPITMAWAGKRIIGLAAQPCSCRGFDGFSCRLGRNEHAVGITLGYENAPWLYVSSGDPVIPSDVKEGAFTLQPGAQQKATFWIIDRPAPSLTDIHAVIRQTYEQFHQPPRACSTIHQTVSDIACAIFRDAFVPSIENYSTRVFLENGVVSQEPLASISWTGGVEVAAPELWAAARLHNAPMRQQALVCINHIVNCSMNDRSGLPFDAFDAGWTTAGWWEEHLQESGHSSYLVGQALYYILQACDTERTYWGQEHPQWLDFVRSCLQHIEDTKDENGVVPYLWSAADGHGLDYDGFSGCWTVAAAVYLAKLTSDVSLLDSAIRSLRYYDRAYVRRLECYGTPLDTRKAIDSEGVLAFIKAARMLHEMTGNSEFLQMLENGLQYEFTFKFCWNPPVQYEPLKKVGWSSCGGSVTSTCNPHIHPMSCNVIDDIAYCFRITGDLYYKSRLEDTVRWALQTYSTFDGEYDFGKKGWMSERFCYSQGLLNLHYENGDLCSTWPCFLPWGASNILEGLCGSVWDASDF